jgi:hypothetical protein
VLGNDPALPRSERHDHDNDVVVNGVALARRWNEPTRIISRCGAVRGLAFPPHVPRATAHQHQPLHFDNAVHDLYGGLVNGATLMPVETSGHTNPYLGPWSP